MDNFHNLYNLYDLYIVYNVYNLYNVYITNLKRKERVEDPDYQLVEEGKQCMSCRFDIDDGNDMGFPRVCDDCANGEDDG